MLFLQIPPDVDPFDVPINLHPSQTGSPIADFLLGFGLFVMVAIAVLRSVEQKD